MPTRPGRDVLMEVLEAEGVQYIFGNPGTTEGAIMHALEDRPNLEYILVAQEGVAVGMADGYARESGRPGFVNLHIETGLSNGLSLMCNAYAGGTPMVVTAANSSIGKVAEGRTDLVDLARPFSKWGAEVTNADQLPAVMRRAFREAKTPPTGPTFVSLAQNALDEMTDAPVAPSGDLSTVLTPDPRAIQSAAELLASAERPALLVGDRVAQYGAVDQVVRVAELLGTPVYGASYPTMMFPTSHPQWMHQLPPYVGLYREAFAETDVLLAVGARVFHDFFAPATGILADDARLVHLDINQDAIGRVEPTDVGIWTDLSIGLDEVYAAVSELQTSGQADAARQSRRKPGRRLPRSPRLAAGSGRRPAHALNRHDGRARRGPARRRHRRRRQHLLPSGPPRRRHLRPPTPRPGRTRRRRHRLGHGRSPGRRPRCSRSARRWRHWRWQRHAHRPGPLDRRRLQDPRRLLHLQQRRLPRPQAQPAPLVRRRPPRTRPPQPVPRHGPQPTLRPRRHRPGHERPRPPHRRPKPHRPRPNPGPQSRWPHPP